MDIVELEGKTLPQLYDIAKGLNIPNFRQLKNKPQNRRISNVEG